MREGARRGRLTEPDRARSEQLATQTLGGG